MDSSPSSLIRFLLMIVNSDQISEEDEKDCLMFHGVKRDAMEEETAGNLVADDYDDYDDDDNGDDNNDHIRSRNML